MKRIFLIGLAASGSFSVNPWLAQGEEREDRPLTRAAVADDIFPLRTERNVVFRRVDGQNVEADLYRPDSPQVLPTIIMIHGGAWIAGDKWNVVDHAKEMAAAGFVVMAINYRLAPKHPWPAQIADCRESLHWIRDHRKEWAADIDRLGVWGYSAGGHLALMMAVDQHSNLPRVRACVAGAPPSDLELIPLKSRVLAGFLGGTREQFPDRYRQASPVSFLSGDDPPIFLFHGDQDVIVPIENSRLLHRKSMTLGIVGEIREVPEKGHLITFLDPSSRKQAIAFLKEHLGR